MNCFEKSILFSFIFDWYMTQAESRGGKTRDLMLEKAKNARSVVEELIGPRYRREHDDDY